MGKSIRTTSNTQTPTNSPPATFKAGDAVLCPSIDNDSPKTFLEAQVAFAQSKHGKRKSYYKKYRATRKPNQSLARGKR